MPIQLWWGSKTVADPVLWLRRCEIETYNRDDVLPTRALEIWVRSFPADKPPAAQD